MNNSVYAKANSADLADILQDEYKIYGVFWNKGSSPTLTRTQDARGAVATAGVDTTKAYNEFDASPLFKDFQEVTDSYGNQFIRIPKMYIKKTDGAGYKLRQISRKPFDGAYLPWCFWDFTNGKELDYVDVGKYDANISDDGLRLESKTGKYPLVNKNIVEFRNYAKANNINGLKGYQQLDIHTWDLLVSLFYIEFATLNSQSICAGYTAGQYAATDVITVATTNTNTAIVANAKATPYLVGQPLSAGTSLGGNQRFTNRTITAVGAADSGGAGNAVITFDGAPVSLSVNDIIYNSGYKSGATDILASSVGSPVNNTDGKRPFLWHGIENLFGNVYQLVDGININERQGWVCKNADNYVSNVFATPYEQLGYVNGSTDGYFVAMGYDSDHPYAELPITVGGSATTYYSDYYYQDAGQRVARAGGYWSNGSYAGMSSWLLSLSSSSASLNVGGRLLRKAS